MKTEHYVILHHVDGEASTELVTLDRQRAIEYAYLKSRTLTVREFVTAAGFAFRGILHIPQYAEPSNSRLKVIHCRTHGTYIGVCRGCQNESN